MKATGVYAIRCIINGKVYVGSAAVSLKERWRNHRSKLQRHKHENSYLQAAWDKHGEQSFEFIVLEECASSECVAREQFWIDEKRAIDRSFGFNLAPRAGSTLGFKLSDEAKAKLSAYFTGKKASPETRAKLSLAHRNPSPEYRAKMSAIKKGEIRSAETRAKIGAAHKGKPLSAETCIKIGAASRGRKHTEATKAIISLTHKGKKKSLETRIKMAKAVQRRWAAKRASPTPLLPFMLDDDDA
jgi:group I intron endonuclease